MITDISMFELDGIELTKKAKQLYPDMPTIVMTGFMDEYTYDHAIEAGAADFLKKPFTHKEIVTRIARVMRDAEVLAQLKEKEKRIESMSTEMISGLQEESQMKLEELKEEIKRLREQLAT